MRTRLLSAVDFMSLVVTLIVNEQWSSSVVPALLGQLPNQIVEELDVLVMETNPQSAAIGHQSGDQGTKFGSANSRLLSSDVLNLGAYLQETNAHGIPPSYLRGISLQIIKLIHLGWQ